MQKANDKNIELILPLDIVIANAFEKDAESKPVDVDKMEPGWEGMDIRTKNYRKIYRSIKNSKYNYVEWTSRCI